MKDKSKKEDKIIEFSPKIGWKDSEQRMPKKKSAVIADTPTKKEIEGGEMKEKVYLTKKGKWKILQDKTQGQKSGKEKPKTSTGKTKPNYFSSFVLALSVLDLISMGALTKNGYSAWTATQWSHEDCTNDEVLYLL